MKRKILAVTGIRSDYDILFPVFQEIHKSPDFDLELIVTGAHLSERFGLTVKQIEKDGFKIAERIENLQPGDTKAARVLGAAVQLGGLVKAVERIKPDFLMVLGDREESLTTATVGAYMDVPVVHLCGGDRVIGNVDDVVRHAVTKLSHIHMATNAESAGRILKLGEESFRVHNVGNPGLDRFLAIPRMTREQLWTFYGLDPKEISKPLLLVVQHVLSSETEHAYAQMKETLEAVKDLGWPTVLSYPNSDPGTEGLIRCIEEYRTLPNLRISKNVPRDEFCNTLRHAFCLLGNSSLGVMEAPFFKLPVLNVGNRQKGRLHAANLKFMPHDRKALVAQLNAMNSNPTVLAEMTSCISPYGDGHSSAQIVEILRKTPIDARLLVKEITYP